MKVIAAIEADFSQGPLGTASRLNQDLLGESVLRRTLKQVLAARRVDRVFLAVEPAYESAARTAADGLEVSVETHNAPPVPWRAYVACSRKWSLDAWRGGIGGTTVFDEFLHPWILEALAGREGAEALVAIPPAAPLLDPQLLDAMIEHYRQVHQEVRVTFTQSAPGLSAAIYMPLLVAELAGNRQPIGRVMAYRPAEPQRDMVMQNCFYSPEAVVAHATGRCIADTGCAIDRIAAILRDTGGPNGGAAAASGAPDAVTVSRWLMDKRYGDAESLPAEVEIELTTEDPLPDSTLRPRGKAVGRRGPMDDAVFDRMIDELSARDDARIVLGGFGDPLLHPRWQRCLDRCRRRGLLGIAVRTPAVTLDEQAADVLVDAQVDVLNVLIDAATGETYQRVHQADHFDRVLANVERVLAAAHRAEQPQPLVVSEMIKTPDTMDELESFYDHWTGKTGAAVLAGPSAYGGQWPDRAVMRMAPAARRPCSRVFHRAMVLADGRVTACDQDFRGQYAIGSLKETSLSDLWSGWKMKAIRRSHLAGRYDGIPLCENCQEWHRP